MLGDRGAVLAVARILCADNSPNPISRRGRGAGSGPGLWGPAAGEGWGGAATGRSRPDLDADVQRMSSDPDAKARAASRREKVLEMLEGFVDDPQCHPMVRIQAGDKLLDRIEGKPIARNVNASVSDPSQLSDADLAAIIAGSGAAPAAPEADQAEPGGVVH